jgi:hypothetical protein
MAAPKRLAVLPARVRVVLAALRATLSSLLPGVEPKSPSGGAGGAIG